MKMKQNLIGLASLLLFWGYGSPESAFQERDQWGSGRTFKWQVSIETRFSATVWNELNQLPPDAQRQLRASNPDLKPGEPVSRHTEMLLTVQRFSRMDLLEFQVSTRNYWARLVFDRRNKLLLVVRPASSMPTSQDQTQNASDIHTTSASVFPVDESPVYLGVPTYHSGIGSEVNVFHAAFLAAAHPLRVKAPFGWAGSKRVEWLTNPAAPEEFILQVEGNKVGTLTVSAEHGYAPASLSIAYGRQKYQWRVKQWERVEGYWMPSLIEYEYSDSMASERASIELVSVTPSSPSAVKSVEEHLTRGDLVVDFRLAGEITDSPMILKESLDYRFEQHLPSVEKLKQLAYQRGNLVPPETPRRRYSLWLFVPAALFFLAAAYLYLKGKRR